MAKKKDYLDQLADAAEELNEVLGLEPAIETDGITKGALEDKIKEASTLLAEEDEISKATQQVLHKLTGPAETEQGEAPSEEEEETDDEFVDSLRQSVTNAKNRKELKALAKAEPEFASIKKQLPNLKTTKELKAAMLEVLEQAPSPSKPEPAPKAKASAKEKQTPKPQAKSKGKKPGVIATIVEIIENCGKEGVTKEEIHQVLVKKFPDKQAKSMKNTVNVQVPHRISTERFKLGKTEEGRFFKK